MSTGEKLLAAGPSRLRQHRSSVFDIALHKPGPCGSSITSFAYEPHAEEHPLKQNKVQYENTYQMDPERKFQPGKVNTIIKDVLTRNLEGKTYDPISCSTLTKILAQEIKVKVKELDFKRYKIVSLVTIGQKNDQGVRIGSRCVWDTDRDSFSSAEYENAHLYATGVVYAVYYE